MNEVEIGTVYQIPLPNGQFAYGRVFRDATIGIFDLLTDRIPDVRELANIRVKFFAGFFDDAISDGTWKVVGRLPFNDADAAWPPPKRVRDILDPDRHRIYEKGEIRSATEEEIAHLDTAAIYRPRQLVERIIGSDLNSRLSDA